jgi:hypothetical protein
MNSLRKREWRRSLETGVRPGAPSTNRAGDVPPHVAGTRRAITSAAGQQNYTRAHVWSTNRAEICANRAGRNERCEPGHNCRTTGSYSVRQRHTTAAEKQAAFDAYRIRKAGRDFEIDHCASEAATCPRTAGRKRAGCIPRSTTKIVLKRG